MMQKILQEVKQYIFSKGRKLEQARWNYHFEQQSKEEVISCLKDFQNEDGGFAHGLEPDFWTHESNPIDTWVAINILDALNLDSTHPMVKKVLDYLKNCTYQEEYVYYFSIPSINSYSHAPWWEYSEDRKIVGYNPSASLWGFILKYENPNSSFYQVIHEKVTVAIESFLKTTTTEKHELVNFIELYTYLNDKEKYKLFFSHLELCVKMAIDVDIDRWFTTYTTRPSDLVRKKEDPGYQFAKDLLLREIEIMYENQNNEGVWDITWSWDEESDIFKKSRQYWMGFIALENVLLFTRV